MATHRVLLVGGPCDGQTKTISDSDWNNGETTCKGAVYVFDGVNRLPHHLDHFTYRPGAPQPPPGPGEVRAPHALNAWADLRGVMNRELPTTLRQVGGLNRATRNLLAKKHRVKG